MSSLRSRFSVVVDNGEPIEVTTTARDLLAAQDYDDPQMIAFALVHHALERAGHDVGTLDEFVDTLDEFVSLEAPGANGAGDLDPTHAAGSESAP